MGERVLPRTVLVARTQRTLYVSGPVLRAGAGERADERARNELVVLEFDTAPSGTVRFVAEADLGPMED